MGSAKRDPRDSGKGHARPMERRSPVWNRRIGDLAVVDGHRAKLGDNDDADHPGHRGRDTGAEGLLGEVVTDRIDDRRHRLVHHDGAHRTGHGVGRDEGSADEPQQDERLGERARTIESRGDPKRGQSRSAPRKARDLTRRTCPIHDRTSGLKVRHLERSDERDTGVLAAEDGAGIDREDLFEHRGIDRAKIRRHQKAPVAVELGQAGLVTVKPALD